MKSIIIHEDAEAELWHAVDFYEDKVPGLGLDFEKSIRIALSSVQEAPKRWPKSKNGARRLLLDRFPFAIFYIEYTDFIWVIAFAHTSRKPFYWKKRIF
ncbi:MAG: hypothetical protein SCARUB_04691 [Candidatus Scalindua rubra]|uniref:Plasmid stabilization system protein n=1 Tax=Candidatus Scalindua rubra TaxID=1872076 RepID=A0A1E3X3H2_9BACT|nr:MAG: hypothetical protein SCARUB_04691 [Candidatus Scalindua rubra]